MISIFFAIIRVSARLCQGLGYADVISRNPCAKSLSRTFIQELSEQYPPLGSKYTGLSCSRPHMCFLMIIIGFRVVLLNRMVISAMRQSASGEYSLLGTPVDHRLETWPGGKVSRRSQGDRSGSRSRNGDSSLPIWEKGSASTMDTVAEEAGPTGPTSAESIYQVHPLIGCRPDTHRIRNPARGGGGMASHLVEFWFYGVLQTYCGKPIQKPVLCL